MAGIVFWQRLFEQLKSRFVKQTIIVGVLVIFLSIVFGALMWTLTQGFLVLEVFCVCPIIVMTFLAFVEIWAKNDYHFYKKKTSHKEIGEEEAVSCREKCSNLRIFPTTGGEWKSFLTLGVNIFALAVFGVITSFGQEKWYVGYTIAKWLFLVELSWLLMIKYRESNYSFTFSLSVLLGATVLVFFSWVAVYALFVV